MVDGTSQFDISVQSHVRDKTSYGSTRNCDYCSITHLEQHLAASLGGLQEIKRRFFEHKIDCQTRGGDVVHIHFWTFWILTPEDKDQGLISRPDLIISRCYICLMSTCSPWIVHPKTWGTLTV